MYFQDSSNLAAVKQISLSNILRITKKKSK